MSPITHFLVGWTLANGDKGNRRDRLAITLAGVAPDIDGLGVVPEILTRNTDNPMLWFSEYHHLLHNLSFAVAVTIAAWFFAARRWKTAVLVFVSFHLHLLGDLIGARGPDGEQWPIPYLLPFSGSLQWAWEGQWYLNAWPNFAITLVLLMSAFYLAWRRGFSPLEMVSSPADEAFVRTLRQRVPR